MQWCYVSEFFGHMHHLVDKKRTPSVAIEEIEVGVLNSYGLWSGLALMCCWH